MLLQAAFPVSMESQEALDNFNKALLGLMQTMVLPEDDGQDN